MVETNSAVAIYWTHPAADVAIKALRDERLEMKNLSIIGKNYEPEAHATADVTTKHTAAR